MTEDPNSIPLQVRRHVIPWKGFNELLRGPLRGRISSDVDVDDLPPAALGATISLAVLPTLWWSTLG